VRRDLLESLRLRQVNHKFHYDSVKQTQKWLALHHAYSPSRTDPDCAAIYDRGFAAAVARMVTPSVHVIGLGCGGGQKDTRLLEALRAWSKEVFYTPSDVSTAMVLVARQAALAVLPEQHCFPLVCDLATADDLPEILDSAEALPAPERHEPSKSDSLLTNHESRFTLPASRSPRLITFFGMIPNFEPQAILPKLAQLIRPSDHLLFSANLAPSRDYDGGVKRILPLYDNDPTRDWLMAFLLDLGVERNDGELSFVIEQDPAGGGLKRIAAYFRFSRKILINVDPERFDFLPEDSIRLFFSYRHTPPLVEGLLRAHGLKVLDQWVAHSEEEGVFLAARA
jgi:uncharacterized SAM-dependent methyltransferase